MRIKKDKYYSDDLDVPCDEVGCCVSCQVNAATWTCCRENPHDGCKVTDRKHNVLAFFYGDYYVLHVGKRKYIMLTRYQKYLKDVDQQESHPSEFVFIHPYGSTGFLPEDVMRERIKQWSSPEVYAEWERRQEEKNRAHEDYDRDNGEPSRGEAGR